MPCSQRSSFRSHCRRFHPYTFHPHHTAAIFGGQHFYCNGGASYDCNEENVDQDTAAIVNLYPFMKHKARVTETKECFTVQMDVPGVKAHQVTIEEKDGEIEITAIRMVDDKNNQKVAHTYQEILYVNKSSANFDGAVAALNNGVLTITVPKKENLLQDHVIVTEASHPPPPLPAEDSNDNSFFRMSFDLPGVYPSDLIVKVDQEQNHVTVTGNRTIGGRPNAITIRRVFEIKPSVDVSQARSYLQGGVFTFISPTIVGSSNGPSPMRNIYVTSADKDPIVHSVASLHLNDGDNGHDHERDGTDETMENGWERVTADEDAKKPPAMG